MVPTVVVYLAVGDLVVGALLQTGRFGPVETRLVWLVLCGYSVGLVATTGSRLLQSSLYALSDTRTPAVVASVRVVLAGALGATLMLQLDHVALVPDGFDVVGDLPALAPVDGAAGLRLGAVGLALASGLAAWVELALLRRAVARAVGPVRLGGGQLARVVAAGAAAAAAALGARGPGGELAPAARRRRGPRPGRRRLPGRGHRPGRARGGHPVGHRAAAPGSGRPLSPTGGHRPPGGAGAPARPATCDR